MPTTFQTAATITRISTRADGSMGLSVVTQELQDKDIATLLKYRNSYGWFLFKENEFKDEEVPAGEARDERKTPCQRLRGVLYRNFELTGKPKGEFDNWYRGEMERIIDHFKKKLD